LYHTRRRKARSEIFAAAEHLTRFFSSPRPDSLALVQPPELLLLSLASYASWNFGVCSAGQECRIELCTNRIRRISFPLVAFLLYSDSIVDSNFHVHRKLGYDPKPFDFHDLEVLSDSLIRLHYCYNPQRRNLAFVRKHLSRWQFAGLFAKYLKKFVLVEVADSNFGCYQMSMILDAVGMHQAPMIVADAFE